MPAITSSAPGKIILCGEHAVVYGAPAIALPVFQVNTKTVVVAKPAAPEGELRIIAPCINLDSRLDSLDNDHPLKAASELVKQALGINRFQACEIRISTSIPIAAGLGSSASVTVSLSRALSAFHGHPLTDDAVNKIAFEVEKLHHGTPSGIDNTVITYQIPVYFIKDKPIEHLMIRKGFILVIADSGTASLTAKTVAGVRERWLADKERYDALFMEIADLSREIKDVLLKDDLTGNANLLTRNHDLLKNLGVSTPKLDDLVNTALDAGAYGAKLSGGGGGGNIIALVNESQADTVARRLEDRGATQTIITSIPSAWVN
ncbi:MAG TPA: mevalonate kinase [Anaerolineaceae bacterium]|nr:mevalonate kinase [Anaerolineaceae bacterium]